MADNKMTEWLRQTAVGTVGTWQPQTLGLDLEGFQVVVEQLNTLETERDVCILERHLENSTGKRLTDLVTFRRLR